MNPVYNTFFSTSDPGQDFEAEALAKLTQGKAAGGVSSAPNSGASSPSLNLASLSLQPTGSTSNPNHSESLASLAMDIDDYDDLYGDGPPPGLSLVAVPTPSLIYPSPPPALLPSKPHLPSEPHMPSRGWGQSPTPFLFCGGALCITTGKSKLPSQEDKNVISLNSDDEDEHLRLYTIGCHSPLLHPDLNLKTHHTPWELNNSPSDLDSSLGLGQLYSTSSSTGCGHCHHGAMAARSVSTQLTSAGESPGSSSSVAH